MSFERDENLDLSGARTVRLGGRDWLIAPLSLRQILAIADYVPKLSGDRRGQPFRRAARAAGRGAVARLAPRPSAAHAR